MEIRQGRGLSCTRPNRLRFEVCFRFCDFPDASSAKDVMKDVRNASWSTVPVKFEPTVMLAFLPRFLKSSMWPKLPAESISVFPPTAPERRTPVTSQNSKTS